MSHPPASHPSERRPPLVLLHGFASSPAAFGRVLQHLPLSQRALALPLPGHAGGRDVPQGGFDACLHVLAVDIQQRLSEPIHLVGYSLGGRLAMGLLALMPSAIARLTLLSAHPGLTDDAERATRRATDREWCALLDRGSLEAFADTWEAQPIFGTRRALPEPVRSQRRAALLANDPRQLALAMAAMSLAEMPNYREVLRDAHCPLTASAGTLDPKFAALAREIGDVGPHVRVRLAADVGHDLLTEAPEQVARILVDE